MAKVTKELFGLFFRPLVTPHKPPIDLGQYRRRRRIFARAPESEKVPPPTNAVDLIHAHELVHGK